MTLVDQHCLHGAPALDDAERVALLAQVPLWSLEDNRIERNYAFRDYHETIAFVNALAWMIHAQDHHPDLTVRYRHCIVS